MIITCTTRITRHYLEHKTKSDLAQMYLDLLDTNIKLEAAARRVVEWDQEYRTINNLGKIPPDCFRYLRLLLDIPTSDSGQVKTIPGFVGDPRDSA